MFSFVRKAGDYLLNRLTEASTYAGLVGTALVYFGIDYVPADATTMILEGVGLIVSGILVIKKSKSEDVRIFVEK